jgi:carboxylesterase
MDVTESSGEVVVDAGSFELSPESSTPELGAGVLCLHGLTGTPYEVRSIAEALTRRGFHCVGPALPGHNTTPEQLATTSFSDWVEGARAALGDLRRRFDRVFVVGMSMGGLVSLQLASEEHPDAVVTIGAPLRFHPAIRLAVPLGKYVYRFKPKTDGSDIRDDAARARHPGYKTMPLAAVHELMKLQRVVAGSLVRITSPIMVAHGVHDHTANPRDARTIFANVNSGARELNLYENSGHVVPVDVDRDALAADVGDFLLAHCKQ